ncbi:SPFH domain-containing protein [Streptomyces avidinii]|uniref:SPFH domain-containing protein n=1 Tax=Streptomyces avidinii TaxID=1895 RepID=UPI0037977260
MFPTRTTSTTGTLRVPPTAAPVAVRAADPATAPAPAPEPAAATATARPMYAAAPASAVAPSPLSLSSSSAGPAPEPAAQPLYGPVPTREHAAAAVAVAAPREAVEASPPPALVGSPAAAEHAGAAETSFGWAAAEAARPAPELPQGWEVPAARSHPYDEGDQGAGLPAAAGLDIPHPQDEEAHAGVATLRLRAAEPEPEREPAPEAEAEAQAEVAVEVAVEAEAEAAPAPEPAAAVQPHSGIPGPGPVEIAARAVARGLDEADGAPEPPRPAARRGTSVVEVPVHLPFRATQQLPVVPAPAPAPPVARAPRPAPGRRVPRGDDRLREHRGPVLPGWVGVSVGGLALAGCLAVLWRAGVVPAPFVAAFGAAPRAYHGLSATHWPPLAFLGVVALVALGGLGRARTGHAWVLTLFGRYRGTVRRTGLTWVSPLLLRTRVDVRLRHWRSDHMPAVDSGGLALQVVVQVVWQVKDTARATLAVEDHTEYLAEQVESAMARVLSQLPADAFHEDAPTLRDAEAVGDALTRMLAAETEAVGIEVFSAQPTRIEYAAEVAEAMRRRRVAAIDAKHRDTVLTSVVDAVDDTVHRLTSRGLVELDDYERKALVKDLTVAFYTGRSE